MFRFSKTNHENSGIFYPPNQLKAPLHDPELIESVAGNLLWHFYE
jgi:hypothetical protein